MKNREKYPNIDDALKAFEKHNKVCNCGCSFEEWLDKENPSLLNMGIAGILLGSLFGEIVDGAKGKSADMEDEKRSSDGKITGVECPICHGKHGKFDDGLFIPFFTCPDCGAYVGINEIREKPTPLGLDGFKSFIADLCKKNNKKD